MTTQEGKIRPRPSLRQGMGQFDVEVYDGTYWVSLNDHIAFYVGAESLANTTQGRRRYTVQSSLYDGDWEVHSTASSVTEQITVHVLGTDQVETSDRLLKLMEMFSQSVYNVRITRDTLRETWRCFPAEWTIDRGQVMTHHSRATVRLSIPRFPKAEHEVVV